MSGLSAFGLGGGAVAGPDGDAHYRFQVAQISLRRVLEFTRHTIDDVVDDPIARNEVFGYYKLHRLVERHCEAVAAKARPVLRRVLRFGPTERLVIEHEDWSLDDEVPVPALPDYVTELGNPGNRKRIKAVYVEFPSPFLRRGLEFVDTPGIGSAIEANTATTERFVPPCDAVLFVTSLLASETDQAAVARRYSIAALRDRILSARGGHAPILQDPPPEEPADLDAANSEKSAKPVDESSAMAALRYRTCAVCKQLSDMLFDFFAKWQYQLASNETAQRAFAEDGG